MKDEKCSLRDLKGNTEFLILAEFMKNPSVKRKELADKLDITEQAISQYISDLESEGLLSLSHTNPKPTKKGIQLMQERFSQLNEEIKAILQQIRIIETCIALAGKAIKTDDEVGLFMREGRLVALPGEKTNSMGIAKSDAKQGVEVLVGNLTGVVDLSLGDLLVLQVPPEIAGGTRNIDLATAKKIIKNFREDEIAAGDLVGEVAANKLGRKPTIVHAPVQASMNALSKGLNILFLGTLESCDQILVSVEELRKKTGYAIKFRTVDIGKLG